MNISRSDCQNYIATSRNRSLLIMSDAIKRGLWDGYCDYFLQTMHCFVILDTLCVKVDGILIYKLMNLKFIKLITWRLNARLWYPHCLHHVDITVLHMVIELKVPADPLKSKRVVMPSVPMSNARACVYSYVALLLFSAPDQFADQTRDCDTVAGLVVNGSLTVIGWEAFDNVTPLGRLVQD